MSRTSSRAGTSAQVSARTSASTRFPLPEPHTRLHPRSIGGVHINTEIHGPQDADAPTVVLVHGWTCSIPFWAPVINALRDDLRVVVYDLRGHGASDVPGPGHYSVQALVDDLETVLDATLPSTGVSTGPSSSTNAAPDTNADDPSGHHSAPPPKAVLVGHSMGGMTLMASALRPSILNRAAAVLLASTGFTGLAAAARIFPFAARSPKWGARATRQVMGSRLPLGPVTPINRSMLRYSTLGPDADKQLATYNAAIIRACPPKSRAAWGKVLDRLELADALAALDVPASVIVGTVDRLTPPPQAHRLAELLPQCEALTELPRVGHMTPLEAPDVLAAEIRRLVAAHLAPGRSALARSAAGHWAAGHLAPTHGAPSQEAPDYAPDGSTSARLAAGSSSSSSADAGDMAPAGSDADADDVTSAGPDAADVTPAGPDADAGDVTSVGSDAADVTPAGPGPDASADTANADAAPMSTPSAVAPVSLAASSSVDAGDVTSAGSDADADAALTGTAPVSAPSTSTSTPPSVPPAPALPTKASTS